MISLVVMVTFPGVVVPSISMSPSSSSSSSPATPLPLPSPAPTPISPLRIFPIIASSLISPGSALLLAARELLTTVAHILCSLE